MIEPDTELANRLAQWARERQMLSSGRICLALIVTRRAIKTGLPLDPKELLSSDSGRIIGLTRQSVQAILGEYGITATLASAGGRTSRGAVCNMRSYVAWLNDNVGASHRSLREVECFWVDIARENIRIQRSIRLRIDSKLSLRAVVRSIFRQAMHCDRVVALEDRTWPTVSQMPDLENTDDRDHPAQKTNGPETMPDHGLVKPTNHPGTERLLQHLVGAKLELVLGREVETHGAFVADTATDRPGDYLIEDVVVHVTTSPREALLRKCSANIDQGLRPLIITTFKNVPVAETMAENAGLLDRVEIFDIEQFVASNILELSKFTVSGRKLTVQSLITRYNRIAACENNPGLLITQIAR